MSDPVGTPPSSASQPPAVVPELPTVEWRRLDSRMLLVHPVQELIRFFPAVIGAFVVGQSGGNDYWQLIGVAVPVLLGVLRYLTTRYRITPTQVELSRGLIGRKVLTARLDRVRAVEVISPPIHRLLGLAKVEIGTASGPKSDEDFALDALALPAARELRVALLHRTSAAAGGVRPGADTVPGGPAGTVPGTASDVVLLRLDPGWVRYAPLTSSGNVIAAAVLALLGQFGERVVSRLVDVEGAVDALLRLSIALLVLAGVAAFLVLGAVFAVLGYLVTNWGFTLSRDTGGRSFHVRRGLVTTTETSLERERLRGIEVSEPLGLRLAGAARLSAVVTGLGGSERGSTQLVPPAPREVVDRVGAEVLGSAEPASVVLRRHGPAARRRRYVRALVGATVTPAALAVLSVTAGTPLWPVFPALLLLPVGAALAADRYRRLGHALTEEHLVIRWGSLRGRRDVLQRTGIIGWNLQQSFFQRRAGLVTLVATTAAGQQGYDLVDVPEALAVELADHAVPGLITPFLR